MAVYIPIVSEFNSKGIDKAIKEFNSLETVGAKANFALKKAALPAAAALGGLAMVMGDAVKSAVEDAAAQQVLATNLRNSANASDATIKSTEALITKMSLATGEADDNLRPAFSKLVLATKDVERSNKLLAISQDIAAATGKPLEAVTTALAKAENGQYAALKKLGIPMSEGIQAAIDLQKEQKKQIKLQQNLASVQYEIAEGQITGKKATEALSKAQEKLANQNKIVNDLMKDSGDYADSVAKAFKGSAAEAAQTAEGKMKRLAVAMRENKEAIGNMLLPALEAVMPILTALGNWAGQHTTTFVALAGAIGTVAAAILAYNAYLKLQQAYTVAATVATTAFNFAMSMNPISLVVIAIAALVAGLVLAYKKFEGFRNIVDSIFGVIKSAVSGSVDVLKSLFDGVLGYYKTIFNGIATLWNNTVGKLSFKVPSWVPGLGGKGFDVPQIPMLADGGIVTSATLAMIGEKGPEAVIPLDRMSQMGGNNVTINVSGGDPQSVVNALRTYMRQNGSVPIRVSNIY